MPSCVTLSTDDDTVRQKYAAICGTCSRSVVLRSPSWPIARIHTIHASACGATATTSERQRRRSADASATTPTIASAAPPT